MKRVMALSGLIGAILALAIVLAVLWARPAQAPEPSPGVGRTATFRGSMVCLPHKNRSGPQTLECALGLKAEDDKLYGIRQTQPTSMLGYDVGQRVSVRGTLTAPTGSEVYDVVGNITGAVVTKE